MHDPFDRRISCGGTALVLGRLKNHGHIWDKIFDQELDSLIRSHDLLNGMPFLWISIDYLYGIKNNLRIVFSRINKKWGVLPIELELDMKVLQWADQNNLELLHDIFMIAALEALIQVGEKYKFKTEILKEERKKYSSIPDTLEDCRLYQRTSLN